MSLTLATIAAGFLALTGAGIHMPASSTADMKGDPFPLSTCPVSGEKLGDDAVVVVLEGMDDAKLNGTQMKFCCNKCVAAYKADPAKFQPKVDKAIIAAMGDAYPLDHCLVMDDEAVDGESKTVVYQNRVYRLCCGKCVRKFNADPAKWSAAYEKAVIAKQKPGYKATTCPISGKPLGDGAVDVVVNGRLVRACCKGCVGPIKADPKAAFEKIDAAK